MSPEILTALEAGAKAMCDEHQMLAPWDEQYWSSRRTIMGDTARAVAAFLRALPDGVVLGMIEARPPGSWREMLAVAVEEASDAG